LEEEAKTNKFILKPKVKLAALMWLFTLVLIPFFINAQQDQTPKKKRVEILWAEDLSGSFDSLKGQIRVLTGNVRLKHNQTYLNCDRAIQLIDSSLIKASGNVHIKKPDTLDIYSKRLIYSSETKLAKLRNSVELHDSAGVLYTNFLDFDLNTDIGKFWNGGKYVGDSSTLTSKSGIYYNKDKIAYFTGDVVYEKVNGLKMLSDTMKYDTENKIVWFVARTKIIDDESVIYTDTGYYNTKTGEAFFGKNSVMKNKNSKLSAEKIKYSKENKQGIATGKAIWQDTVEQIIILADSIVYLEDSAYVMATKDPFLIDINEKDTLFLSSDTLISYQIIRTDSFIVVNTSQLSTLHTDSLIISDTVTKTDSLQITPIEYAFRTDTFKAYKAYNNVKIFQNRFSGICDSLSFSYVDSILKFYQDPVMWVDTSQFTSDSVYVFSKNEKTDKIILYQKAFVISMTHPELFNQVRGRIITAFFEDDSLRRVFVDGNAESIYFIKDDSSAYVGMNKTKSSTIKMYFKGKEIDRIICFEQPEGVFTPMKLTNSSNQKFENFNWRFELKPITAYDVIRNSRDYQIEYLDKLFLKEEAIELEIEEEESGAEEEQEPSEIIDEENLDFEEPSILEE
jgi:lipopolysaccharide export system protein LptA